MIKRKKDLTDNMVRNYSHSHNANMLERKKLEDIPFILKVENLG
jgi:hypothetical protein